MIRKTVKIYKKLRPDWLNEAGGTHIEKILRTTYWFLFIPIYSSEKILTSDI
jgi:hypothetical protein